MGYGGFAVLDQQDDHTVIYKYGAINLNMEEKKNVAHTMDGQIVFEKEILIVSDIHFKIKHMSNGKKREIIKRIPQEQPVYENLQAGKLMIENSKYCWRLVNQKYDYIAISLFEKISSIYQTDGMLPPNVSIIW